MTIKEILIERDGLTEEKADELIQEAREDLLHRLANDYPAWDICEDHFGLEPDYIEELL